MGTAIAITLVVCIPILALIAFVTAAVVRAFSFRRRKPKTERPDLERIEAYANDPNNKEFT